MRNAAKFLLLLDQGFSVEDIENLVLDVNPTPDKVTTSGTTITGLVESNDSGMVIENTQGTPQYNAADPVFGGKPSIYCAAATSDLFGVGGYDGTAEGWCIAIVTGAIADAGSGIGYDVDLYRVANSGRVLCTVHSAAGVKRIAGIYKLNSTYASASSDAFVANRVQVMVYRALKVGGDILYEVFRNGRKIIRETITHAWSAIGSLGSVATLMRPLSTTRKYARILVYDSIVSDEEVADLSDYLINEYNGHPWSLDDIGGMYFFSRADAANIVEPTVVFDQPKAFDNAAWTKSNTTINADAIANPIDATVDADEMVEVAGTTLNRQVFDSITGLKSNIPATVSVYAKSNGCPFLYMSSNSASQYGFFDLVNGTLGTFSGGSSGTITDVGDGWYLCTITFTNSPSFSIGMTRADNTLFYTVTGGDEQGIYVYNATVAQPDAVGTFRDEGSRGNHATAGTSAPAFVSDWSSGAGALDTGTATNGVVRWNHDSTTFTEPWCMVKAKYNSQATSSNRPIGLGLGTTGACGSVSTGVYSIFDGAYRPASGGQTVPIGTEVAVGWRTDDSDTSEGDAGTFKVYEDGIHIDTGPYDGSMGNWNLQGTTPGYNGSTSGGVDRIRAVAWGKHAVSDLEWAEVQAWMDATASASWRDSMPTALGEYAAVDYSDYTSVPHLGDNTGSGKRLTSASGREGTYSATAVGGGPGIAFAASGDWFDASTAAQFKSMHGATDCTVEVRYECTAASGTCVIAATNTPGSGVGVYIAHDAANQRVQIQWRDSTGAIGTYLGTNGSAANNTAHHLVVRVNRLTSTYSVRLNGVWVASDVAFARTPDTADSASPLRLGAAPSGSFIFTGAIHRFAVWARRLTTEQIELLEANAPSEVSQRTRHVVLVMGDSITLNVEGRKQLYLNYLDSGTHRLKMVGHVNTPAWDNPTPDHGGVSGDRVDEWQADQVARFAAVSEAPTHIVSALGMNDCVDNSGAWGDYAGSDERLVALMSDALTEWPFAVPILMECTPSTSGAINTRIDAFNVALAAQVTAESWTLGVSTLNADAADISGDDIHPTTVGYGKWADDVATALGVLP